MRLIIQIPRKQFAQVNGTITRGNVLVGLRHGNNSFQSFRKKAACSDSFAFHAAFIPKLNCSFSVVGGRPGSIAKPALNPCQKSAFFPIVR